MAKFTGYHLALAALSGVIFWVAVGTFVWFLLGGPGWLPLVLAGLFLVSMALWVLNFVEFMRKMVDGDQAT